MLRRISIDEGASMPRRRSFVVAGLATAAALCAATSAFAGRQVHGGDVARVLAGKAFGIECVDGTQGRGKFSQQGAVSVSYRRPSSPRGTPDEHDHANVQVRGVEICLSWRQFGGGGNGCYPVFEESHGRFRFGGGPLWCDISPK
jgi:hypothetical protein